MEINNAVTALGALAQETRLAIFRLLMQTGEAGLPVGQVADALRLAPATLSFHLKALMQAGLISQSRQGRSLICRAEFLAMSQLLAYLTENCCQGTPCLPVLGDGYLNATPANLECRDD